MKRVLVLIALLALMPATPSDAQARARASAWTYPKIPVPQFTVVRANCPFYTTPVSCSYTNNRVIFWAPGNGRWTFLHEQGHMLDAQLLNAPLRGWLTVALGYQRGTSWWGALGPGVTGAQHQSPGESFADVYANCRQRNAARRFQRICAALAWLG